MATIATVALFIAGAASQAGSVAGGGSWLSPVKDRYEPGDTVILVGYSGGISNQQLEGDQWNAYITRFEDDRPVAESRFEAGTLEIELTDQGGYLSARVSLEFAMPNDATPGQYGLDYCRGICPGEGQEMEWLGDIIGGTFSVGVDPEWEITREWALNEPEIANMDPDGLIAGPGFTRTAAEVLALEIDENGRATVTTSTTTTTQTSTSNLPSTTAASSSTKLTETTEQAGSGGSIEPVAAVGESASGDATISPLTGGAPDDRGGWWLLLAAGPIVILTAIRLSVGRDGPSGGARGGR